MKSYIEYSIGEVKINEASLTKINLIIIIKAPRCRNNNNPKSNIKTLHNKPTKQNAKAQTCTTSSNKSTRNKRVQLKLYSWAVFGAFRSSLTKNSASSISGRTLRCTQKKISCQKLRLMDCGKAKTETFMSWSLRLSPILCSRFLMTCSICFTVRTRKSNSDLCNKAWTLLSFISTH